MTVVWQDPQTDQRREFSREDLDASLSPSRFVDSLDVELEKYAQRSRAAREQAAATGTLREGLSYGPGDANKLDLFLPADNKSPAPLLIYVHGGFWQQLSRRESAFAAPGITARGGAVAAVGYTLAPQASLGDIVEEIFQAIAFVYREAPGFGLDRTRFVLAGSSAGAHLVAMALLNDWTAYGLPENFPGGAVLVSGVYDLAAVARSYVNEPLSLTADDIESLSPRRQVPRHSCPLVLAYSVNEPEEFKRESRCYAERLERHGQAASVREIAGRHHFDVIMDLDDSDTYLGHATWALLDANSS